MPMLRERYPENWEDIALAVKTEANWTCEECGRPCRQPGEKWLEMECRLLESNYYSWFRELNEQGKRRRFVLTTAHLDHNPANCDRGNLKALCCVCHCRYDTTPQARAIKRKLKAEFFGQLSLEGV